jgi:hypothetical protein
MRPAGTLPSAGGGASAGGGFEAFADGAGQAAGFALLFHGALGHGAALVLPGGFPFAELAGEFCDDALQGDVEIILRIGRENIRTRHGEMHADLIPIAGHRGIRVQEDDVCGDDFSAEFFEGGEMRGCSLMDGCGERHVPGAQMDVHKVGVVGRKALGSKEAWQASLKDGISLESRVANI